MAAAFRRLHCNIFFCLLRISEKLLVKSFQIPAPRSSRIRNRNRPASSSFGGGAVIQVGRWMGDGGHALPIKKKQALS